ncbi:MAG: hypothetical protein AAF215_35290 [Cyanobacteria bacterium P01_A01_bin.123]
MEKADIVAKWEWTAVLSKISVISGSNIAKDIWPIAGIAISTPPPQLHYQELSLMFKPS